MTHGDDIISTIIKRLQCVENKYIIETFKYIKHWLYELNKNPIKKNKYKNITDDEIKDAYNIISHDLYNTYFSFTSWDTNEENVVIYFFKEMYFITYQDAKTLYDGVYNQNFDNQKLLSMISKYKNI